MFMYTTQYNDKSPQDILKHAKQLEGISLREYIENQENDGLKKFLVAQKNTKGSLGTFVEEIVFNYAPNSRKEADFTEAGVELKVTPLKKLSNSNLTIKERLVLSLINYNEIVNEEWESNSLFTKLKLILLMFYLYQENTPNIELVFKLVSLWQPSEEDLRIIENDWKAIVEKIKAGKAHEISEGDTSYLGACPKGRNSQDTTAQPYSNIRAMRRAFSLKTSYMRAIWEELHTKHKAQALSKSGEYELVVVNKFKKLYGKSISKLDREFKINLERKAKNYISLFMERLSKQLFGDSIKKLAEFKKSGIEVKCILLQENGVPRESMSFPMINYKEIIEQDWETSDIKQKFENEKHLWLIFKAKKKYSKQSELSLDDIIFEKAMFWNMPAEDLNKHMYYLWKDTVKKIKKGNYDDFLKTQDNPVGHIRPHARNSGDVMETPQGTFVKKKCFWLNAKYIAEQIRKKN